MIPCICKYLVLYKTYFVSVSASEGTVVYRGDGWYMCKQVASDVVISRAARARQYTYPLTPNGQPPSFTPAPESSNGLSRFDDFWWHRVIFRPTTNARFGLRFRITNINGLLTNNIEFNLSFLIKSLLTGGLIAIFYG